MALDPDQVLTLITFPHEERWNAAIHELIEQSLTPSGEGSTAQEARADLYGNVKALKPALDAIDEVKVSARTTIESTVLADKKDSEID